MSLHESGRKPLSQMTDTEAVAAGRIRIVRLGSIEELLRRPVPEPTEASAPSAGPGADTVQDRKPF